MTQAIVIRAGDPALAERMARTFEAPELKRLRAALGVRHNRDALYLAGPHRRGPTGVPREAHAGLEAALLGRGRAADPAVSGERAGGGGLTKCQ